MNNLDKLYEARKEILNVAPNLWKHENLRPLYLAFMRGHTGKLREIAESTLQRLILGDLEYQQNSLKVKLKDIQEAIGYEHQRTKKISERD